MSTFPTATLVRHGETAWSLSGQHTGRTDLPLTPHGEELARGLAERLRGIDFARVFTSPLQRATRTCELAGFGAVAEREDALLEWDYGAYEGRTTKDILAERPGWKLFRDGCPHGEMPGDVAARADAFIARVRALDAPVLLFSSGHLLRVLASSWLGMPPDGGRLLTLGTGSVSRLGYEHDRDEPVIQMWNLSGTAGG